MKILVKTNYEKSGSVDATRRTLTKLIELGHTPMVINDFPNEVGSFKNIVIGPFPDLLSECDILLTIGGDGTILHAVSEMKNCRKPILGINTGRIGFLTQLEVDELDKLSLLGSGCTTTVRMMIEITLVKKEGTQVIHALNDAVLSRGDSDRLVEIAVSGSQGHVVTHRGDGIIFSTPTGSTAYSLSAGGSIVHPSLEVILITAICPHSPLSSSLILSPNETYSAVEIAGNNPGGLIVTIDGIRIGTLYGGEHLKITKSAQSIPFIDLGVRDFYSCVAQKLSFGR